MKNTYSRFWIQIAAIMVLVASLLLASSALAQESAQVNQPKRPVEIRSSNASQDTVQERERFWRGQTFNESVRPADVAATGGPDDFGYTWNDAVPFNWIDATTGVDTGLAGVDAYTGPIDIGFAFKFYENTYTQFYVSTNGLITFGGGSASWSNQPIPSSAQPNNFIAPFWDDLAVGSPYNSGKVYYLSGGASPNRYLVIEWHNVTACCTDEATDYKTFEVILYENGDIVMQYLHLSGYLGSATVGIEDDAGVTGLEYLYNMSGLVQNKAIRFYRPAPSARVKVWPVHQGGFTSAGHAGFFQILIRNTGEVGADTYDLTSSSTWPVTFYAADGVSLLTDTDGDGVVDTGSLPQREIYTVTLKMQTPPGAVVGDNNTASITVRSSLNGSKSKTVVTRSAVPTAFAQVYQDADGAMSLYLAQPAGQTANKVTSERHYGYNTSVVETPNGDFVYAWQRGRCLRTDCTVYVDEIEYALLDRYGEIIRAPSKLVNHNDATIDIYDSAPAIAVSPNNRIGMLWYRSLWNGNTGQSNDNVYFAILDASGNQVFGPVNLTNNTAWGDWNAPNIPRFWDTRITATGDNRFVLAWSRQNLEQPNDTCTGWCWLEDVYYAVRDTNGGSVREPTKLTTGMVGGPLYGTPTLAALSNNHVFLGYSSGAQIHYAVLNSSGGTVKAQTDIAMGGWIPAAVQLANGKVVMAWSSPAPRNPGEGTWNAQFFNNETLSGPPVVVRTDSTIDFGWWEDAPAPGVNPDFFSARWTGTITVDAGTYIFTMGSDDGSRLWIDDQLVMDHWDECCEYWSTAVPLSAGAHQVRMEMHEHDGAAWAYLSWRKQDDKTATTFAVLDAAYNVVAGPTRLNNPFTVTGDMYVSIAADAAGRAVLSWTENYFGARRNLYYALVDGNGAVLTPPMIFRSVQASSNVDGSITSSYIGYGATSYRWTPPSGVDGVAKFSGSLFSGPPGGRAVVDIRTTNRGSAVASSVTLTATLGSGLTYDSDTSGITPTVTGNTVVWNLPDMRLFDSQNFLLYLQTLTGADYGSRFPVTLTLTSGGAEVNPSDNMAATDVMIARQVFLPITNRSRD